MNAVFEKFSENMGEMMRAGEDSFMELIKSEIHECIEKLDTRVIFYVTPDNILKYNTNVQSSFCMSQGVPVKCCMWCGFQVIK